MKKMLLLGFSSLLILLSSASVVYAVDLLGNQCNGNNTQCANICQAAPESTVCKSASDAQGKNTVYGKDGILTKVIQIIAYITGIASIIVIMIAGLKFVTSGGEGNSVASAKKSIIYAVVGIVIAIFAQSIVSFVLNKIN